MFRIILMLSILLASRMAAQRPSAAERDSVFFVTVRGIAIRHLSDEIAVAPERKAIPWWKIEFPAVGDPGPWRRLRDHLMTAIRARDSMPGDSVYRSIGFSPPDYRGDTVVVEYWTGRSYRCPSGRWMGDYQSLEWRVTWSASDRRWISDTQPRGMGWAESFGLCG